jgi:E3 ubiquitin-protein ligase RAD18
MASKTPLEDEITDSTDWLKTTIPKLEPVDAALRCHVCKDFYITPMITSCSHTFCSLCIRRCLNLNSECPECRRKDQEVKLKPNSAIAQLVEAFLAARPSIMEIARRPTAAESPKRKREIHEDASGESPIKKRTSRRTTRSTPMMILDSDESDGDEYLPGMLRLYVLAA